MESRGSPTGPSREPTSGVSGYIFPAIIIIASFALFFYMIYIGITSNLDKLVQVVIPGSVELHFDEPGEYTVYHEYVSEVDGVAYLYQGARTFSCTLENLSTNTFIPPHTPGFSSNYEYFNKRKAVSYIAFDVVTPGDYEFSCGYGDQTGPQTVMAISLGFWSAVFEVLGQALILLAIGIGISIYMVVSINKEKEKSAKRWEG